MKAIGRKPQKDIGQSIRALESGDRPEKLIDLFLRSMAGFHGYERELMNEILEHLQNHKSDTHYFVAVNSEDKIVGLIGYVLETQDVYQLGWFAVDEDHKNMGVGTALIKHIEGELAGRARLLMAEVWVSENNPAASAFYIKNGYVPTATIQNYYNDENGDMTFFIKRLKPKSG